VFKQRSDDRLLIRIEQTLQAEHTIAGAAFVTFTFETWNQLINTHRRRYPELRLLGWYHSHPGFGIFLSSMDRFIHQGFFVMPWHVALVVDPVKNQVGIFARGPLDIYPPDVFDWVERPCSAQSPAGDLSSAVGQL
jgi:proteasome lid subunit RPN8/RPN11